jgi:DNA-binding transcriptional LysR family regulator
MDFRQLRYFVAVAEELSFSAAARRLHISQPPLSLQIRAIEEELGAQLFKRDSRKVELTNAGELLLDGARKALAQLDRASEIVRQAVRGEAGELRVAFTASVPMFDAFQTIQRKFRESHPAVIADVGFLRPSPFFYPPGGISVKELWNDRLVAVLPVSHPLAVMNTPVPMEALAREDFILFPRGLGCGLFEHVSTLASRAGFGPRIRQEAREGTTILGLIAAGMGVSILPEI